MGTKTFYILSITLAILFSLSAVAGEVSGKTADGCTYKVINGQYLTSCPKRGSSDAGTATVTPVAQDQTHNVSSGPVTDYGAVPVRHSYGANSPSLPPQQHTSNAAAAPVSSIEREGSVADADDFDSARRERIKNKLIDKTHVGLFIGASNMKQSNAGSSTGFGLSLGTELDDIFGVDLGYSYARQDLNLGLASRASNTDPNQPQVGYIPNQPSSDASLSSNLFTGEIKAHLTDPVKRLRPYAGAGLGWRSASLSENANSQSGLAGGTLSQSALGGIGSLGTTLRITKTLDLGFMFRYFFPIARQDARLEQPIAAMNGQTPQQSKLSSSDDLLTGSSQYQILGGVQYSF